MIENPCVSKANIGNRSIFIFKLECFSCFPAVSLEINPVAIPGIYTGVSSRTLPNAVRNISDNRFANYSIRISEVFPVSAEVSTPFKFFKGFL